MKEVVFTALCLLWISVHKVHGYTADDEYNLRQMLTAVYDKTRLTMVPRLTGSEETLNVTFGMTLVNVVEFSEDTESIKVYGWDEHSWMDQNLAWNPDEYGGIPFLRVPRNLIWIPDIVQFDSLDIDPFHDDVAITIVYSNGFVHYIPRSVHTSRCQRSEGGGDDKQRWKCDFKFLSWSYDTTILDVQFYNGLEKIDTANLVPTTKYVVVGTSAKREVKIYECCEGEYPSLIFTLEIEVEAKKGSGHRGSVSVVAFIASLVFAGLVAKP